MRLTDPLTLELIALERLETQRREVARERLQARPNDPEPEGWLERYARGFRLSRTRGGDARVNARQR